MNITFNMSKEDIALIDDYAKKSSLKKSTIVQLAVREYIVNEAKLQEKLDFMWKEEQRKGV